MLRISNNPQHLPHCNSRDPQLLTHLYRFLHCLQDYPLSEYHINLCIKRYLQLNNFVSCNYLEEFGVLQFRDRI